MNDMEWTQEIPRKDGWYYLRINGENRGKVEVSVCLGTPDYIRVLDGSEWGWSPYDGPHGYAEKAHAH